MSKSRGIGRGHRPDKSRSLFEIEWHGHTSACWIWKRRIIPVGYGMINRKLHPFKYAHRWMYEMTNGPIPNGLHLDHLCRVPSCVRPNHLEAVTCKENVRRGAGTKLGEKDIETIRTRRANGEIGAQIAREYGVTRAHISRIWTRKVWK